MPMPFGLVEDPIDDKERIKVAGSCVEDLDLPMPALIDGVDDKVGRAYGGWPDRLYLIGRDGHVAFQGEVGPFGFKPEELAHAIVLELEGSAAGA